MESSFLLLLNTLFAVMAQARQYKAEHSRRQDQKRGGEQIAKTIGERLPAATIGALMQTSGFASDNPAHLTRKEDAMPVYLVQHGQCMSKSEDPRKGLTEEGAEQVRLIARVAAGYGVQVSAIHHSGKRRAEQTAALMAEILAFGATPEAVDGIGPLDDAAAYGAGLDLDGDLMVVGHLPFLERLMSELVLGRIEPPLFEMQNGGIVCLDRYRDTPQVVVKWALMPHIA